ncbi:hypothetical protein ACQP2T_03240 [Nonomuraea sp. CA-143628]|uniref:hypothetical protein n=1 Tax=Nonomuraea sp. CA-143628 TaxID=3239997 RepID=UPI003D8FB8D4
MKTSSAAGPASNGTTTSVCSPSTVYGSARTPPPNGSTSSGVPETPRTLTGISAAYRPGSKSMVAESQPWSAPRSPGRSTDTWLAMGKVAWR